MTKNEKYRVIRAGLILEGSSLSKVAEEFGLHKAYVRDVALGNRSNSEVEERLARAVDNVRQVQIS